MMLAQSALIAIKILSTTLWPRLPPTSQKVCVQGKIPFYLRRHGLDFEAVP